MEFPHPTEINAKRMRIRLILAAVFAVIGLVVYLKWPNEPMYHFRTLTSWLEDYANPLRDVHSPEDLRNTDVHARQVKASEAVLAIGTNAIPTLLRYVLDTDVDSRAARMLFSSRARIPFALHPQLPEDKHDLARAGFILLQRRAAPAIPDLMKLTRHQDPDVRIFAAECLVIVVAGDPKVVIPIYVQFGHDADPDNRQKAAEHLKTMLLLADEAQKASIYEAFPELREASPKTH